MLDTVFITFITLEKRQFKLLWVFLWVLKISKPESNMKTIQTKLTICMSRHSPNNKEYRFDTYMNTDQSYELLSTELKNIIIS